MAPYKKAHSGVFLQGLGRTDHNAFNYLTSQQGRPKCRQEQIRHWGRGFADGDHHNPMKFRQIVYKFSDLESLVRALNASVHRLGNI
jgi:hypothetical protein